MNRSDAFQVRTMRRDELSFTIDLAANEGWNPSLHDAECFFSADPAGFLIGELADEPVGCVSAVSYGGRYGFVGLYIVRPEFRGHGYGRQLFRAALARLHDHDIGLDGVVAQQGKYAHYGFRLAYRNLRFRGHARPATSHASIQAADEVAFDAIRDLDRQIFPEPRDAFLRAWLSQPAASALVARAGASLTTFELG
jgi:GNAT superfamily N-acetyltransferase